MTRIIDAHTHAFSPDVIARRERYLARDDWFGQLYANPAAKLASPEDILLSMDAVGIERSVLCGFPWADAGICREQSAWLADVCQDNPARFSFTATVVPQSPEAADDVARARSLGAVGIGELNADGQKFDLTDPPSLAAFIDACRGAQLPVLLQALGWR